MNKIENFKDITEEMLDLYIAKNTDYGDAFGTTFKKYGVISALTRISDKFNRLEQLITSRENQLVKDESIEDTLKDLASYCIMTLIELKPDEIRIGTHIVEPHEKGATVRLEPKKLGAEVSDLLQVAKTMQKEFATKIQQDDYDFGCEGTI